MTEMRSSARRYLAVGATGIAALVGGCTIEGTGDSVAVLTIVSGSQQTVKVGQTSAQPLVVKALDVNGLGMSDVEVTWDLEANAGTVSASSTFTDETGQASVTYTAPATPGNVQINATADNLTVTFNLVIAPLSGS